MTKKHKVLKRLSVINGLLGSLINSAKYLDEPEVVRLCLSRLQRCDQIKAALKDDHQDGINMINDFVESFYDFEVKMTKILNKSEYPEE